MTSPFANKMKNRFLLLTCVLLFAGSIGAQIKPQVDFAKKIAEATPPELPQSPDERRGGADARDQGLKGKVKKIVLSGTDPGDTKRVIYGDEEFNRDGNLTRTIAYHEGFPLSVAVWGYIDGQRVSRSKDVVYASGEIPAFKVKITTVVASDIPRDPKTMRDTRYGRRHVKKYDARGRLIESIAYRNNGEMVSRTTYTYTGNRRDQRRFLYDKEYVVAPNFIRVNNEEILDKQGNVVGLEYHYDDGRVIERHSFTHQFDPHGNWIIKNTFKETTEGGKKSLKLLRTLYRTIEYYEDTKKGKTRRKP
jgi:hypothetical protein